MILRRFIKHIILLLFVHGTLWAQSELSSKTVVDTFSINLENIYKLNSISIVPLSELIQINNRLLTPDQYTINYQKAEFNLSDTLNYSIFDSIYVSYKTIKLNFSKTYKKRSLVVKFSENFNDSIRVIKSDLTLLSSEEIFGKSMQRSGSIARGFQIGSNRDLSVTSGLRLQLSGRLSDDIEIVAALTDENTPIQPEGNTERLDELDKVFIEVRHQNAVGTFGDYELNDRVGEFGNINRKLQGLKGEVLFEDVNGMVALAGSRGTFNTMQFLGEEGNQGPYRLTGKNGERNIILIAGSEKVYIDGQLMKRGENNDYIIEYSNAEITFTPNKLITSASRITVDYEYSDRKYQRNYFGGNLRTKFFENKLSVSFSFQQEGDDKNSPIDIVLSDDDVEKLENAGDDELKAIQSGVSLASEDSNGVRNGTYTKVDTLIDGNDYVYFVYAPSLTSSIYNVVFSYVGEGQGAYIREAVGKYKFIGRGSGAYSPVKLLPLPESKKLGNILIDYKPIKDVSISAEFAGSIWDKNRFSTVDNDDNNGFARNIFLQVKPRNISLFGYSLGRAGISYKDRYIDSKFTSLDRINDIEFDREYNTSSSDNEDETLRELQVNLLPVKPLSILAKYGYLKEGNSFKSNRVVTNIKLQNEKKYSVDYNLDYVNTKNLTLNSSWIRQKSDAYYIFGVLKPGVKFEAEEKKDKIKSTDSLITGSLKFNEINPYIELSNYEGLSLTASYSYRNDFLPMNNKLVKEAEAATQSYTLNYKGIPQFSTGLNLTVRNKKYTNESKNLGYLDTETILVRSQSRFNFWQRLIDGTFFYETATEKSAKLEKLYIQVPVGTGNYKYLGDLNNNGIADEEEFEPTLIDGDFILTTIPSDELFPVINLQTSTRWKIDLSKISKKRNIFNNILNALYSETFFRIEENNKTADTKQIYLLNFDYFLHDSLTIRGSNLIQQDLHIFRNNNELSFRVRYNQRKYLNQFSQGTEKGYYSERSIRMRMRLVKEITNQTDISNTIDNVDAPVTAKTARNVDRTDITTDFSYRPANNIEVGFKISLASIEDKFPEVATIINSNSQSLRFTFSFAGKGRLRIEGERNELSANVSNNFIPFEIMKGNSLGKNYTWGLNLDYRISNNLQTQISYNGRQYGSGRVLHSLQAEARAYF